MWVRLLKLTRPEMTLWLKPKCWQSVGSRGRLAGFEAQLAFVWR
jgi:hypothetical protein